MGVSGGGMGSMERHYYNRIVITTASSRLLDDNDAGPARRIGEFGCPLTPE
jgi:hypothetical protein